MPIEPAEGFSIPSADVHQFRELLQRLIALQDEFTPVGVLELKHLVRKMNRIISPGA